MPTQISTHQVGDIVGGHAPIPPDLPIGTEVSDSRSSRDLQRTWRKFADNSWGYVESNGDIYSGNRRSPIRDEAFRDEEFQITYLPPAPFTPIDVDSLRGLAGRVIPEVLPDVGQSRRERSALSCGCHSCLRSVNRLDACNCDRCRRDRGEDMPAYCLECDIEFPESQSFGGCCGVACFNAASNRRRRANRANNGDPDLVRYYSYRPYMQFHAADTEVDPKLFFGFELEVPTDKRVAFAQEMFDTFGDKERLMYCKEDGSINGVEIVSHPMTHQFLREKFPFEMFDKRRKLTKMLRDTDPSEGYGLHIHVSRTGFKNEAHILRWLLLVYRNQTSVEALARRTSDQWAHFNDGEKCVEKAKNIWIDYDGHEYSGYEGERYVAVNAQNQDTFEIRVFRSTWDLQQFRASLDFAHATVEYTREMPVHDITNGDGLSFAKFRDWVAEKPEYEALTKELNRVLPRAESGENSIPLSEVEEELACAS